MSKTKRFILHPGEIVSENDGDIHFVSAKQLCALYNVDMKECYIDLETVPLFLHQSIYDKMIHLYPRSDGNYHLRNRGKP